MNGHCSSTTPTRRLVLFSKGRTASNLLMRIINLDEQQSLLQGEQRDYYFFDIMMKRGSWNDHNPAAWTLEGRRETMKDYQACFDDLHDHVQRAEAQAKDVFVKEHASTIELRRPQCFSDVDSREITVDVPGAAKTRISDSVFSDEYLKTWRPTFLIRHPALCFPSMHLRSTRSLYEWYMEQKKTKEPAIDSENFPLILDAEDVITRPDVVVAYTKKVGLDPMKLKFNWKSGQIDVHGNAPEAVIRRFLSSLTASKGIDRSKAPKNVDIDVESAKWKKEFGEEIGANIEGLVRDAMPDYDFLRARRVRSDNASCTPS